MISWTIHKLRDGGYFAQERGGRGLSEEMYHPPLFASAKIGEVLEYIRDKLEKADIK